MPGIIKVGYSTKDLALRAQELNHTASSHPYSVQYETLVWVTLPQFHVHRNRLISMYMKLNMGNEAVPKRQYTEEFRLEAVRLADSVGGHEATRRLGVPIATLGNWLRRSRKALCKETTESAPGRNARRSPTDLEAENSQLRKELASARLDVEIFRKATAYFAKG